MQQQKTRIPYWCNPTLPYPTVVVIQPSKTPLLLSSKSPGLLPVVLIQPSRTCPCCCHPTMHPGLPCCCPPTLPDSPAVVIQPFWTYPCCCHPTIPDSHVVVIQQSRTPLLLSSNPPRTPVVVIQLSQTPLLLLSNHPGLPCCCYPTIPDSPVVVI